MIPLRSRKQLLALTTVVASLAAIAPASAGAATYYVGGTGAKDTNPGTSAAKPWATISKAMTAPDGSLVLVKAGRYPGIRAAAGIQHRTAPVTIQRADYSPGDDPRNTPAAAKVVIGTPNSAGVNTIANVIGVTFKGVQFNTTTSVSGADRFGLIDSEIGPTYTFGVYFQKGSLGPHSLKNSTITGNWFHDSNQAQKAAGIQRTGGHMIVVAGPAGQTNTDITVARNRFDRILDGDGMQIAGAARVDFASNAIMTGAVGEAKDHVDALQVLAPVTDMTIRRNFVGDGIRGFLIQQKARKVCLTSLCTSGTELKDWKFENYYSGVLSRFNIENNVATGPDFSLRLMGASDARVVNNTFWGKGFGRAGYGVSIVPAAIGDPRRGQERIVFVNNIARDLEVVGGTDFLLRSNNIAPNNWATTESADFYGSAFSPVFAGAGDYSLGAGDVNARDRGTDEFAAAVDHNGMLRDDGKPDIGAYEFGATTPGPDAGPAGMYMPGYADGPQGGVGSANAATTARVSRIRFRSAISPTRARAELAQKVSVCASQYAGRAATRCRQAAVASANPQLSFRLSRPVRVTVELRRCRGHRCTTSIAVPIAGLGGRNKTPLRAALRLRKRGSYKLTIKPKRGRAASRKFRVR